MWWTRTFTTLNEAVLFLNSRKITKMQILHETSESKYTVIYWTECN